MSKLELAPNGVSFTQIKKYAKRLKKESNLSSQEALNQVTKELTQFDCWEALIEYNKKRGGSLGKIKTIDRDVVIYADKPIYIMKSMLHKKVGFSLISKNKKLLYITNPRMIEQTKKTMSDLSIDPEMIIIKTFHDIFKNGINENDIDVIYIDEAFITDMSFNAIKTCYEFGIKHRVIVFHLHNMILEDFFIKNNLKARYLKKYIENIQLLDPFYLFKK